MLPTLLLLAATAATGYARPELLVETDWLATHWRDANVRVIDMRTSGYAQAHVPGALHLENAAIRAAAAPPTFLPSTDEFERLMAKLGIGNDTRVIAYDDRGGIYAARLWFVLNAFGHANVALLNGGWTKWTREQRPTTTDVPAISATAFRARPQPRWIATADDVLAAIERPGVRIVDARTAAEIEGTDRRGIRRGGFIRSAIPVYWEDALDPDLKTFRPAAEIEKLYRGRGIGPDDEVIAYCQVGMRAAHDLFALALIGHTKLRNYYGAWEEWGNRSDLPVETRKVKP
jgi:thiosulfate/3-mercaptopyruvate sulfurtransferase